MDEEIQRENCYSNKELYCLRPPVRCKLNISLTIVCWKYIGPGYICLYTACQKKCPYISDQTRLSDMCSSYILYSL